MQLAMLVNILALYHNKQIMAYSMTVPDDFKNHIVIYQKQRGNLILKREFGVYKCKGFITVKLSQQHVVPHNDGTLHKCSQVYSKYFLFEVNYIPCINICNIINL